ncbi:MAG: PAS domain S-box protein [Deltaproteobacteria bacterium]|nr:PAS domain S-box protein [Deltaproteobacteria bacterium]MBW2071039.1 PAS domain S-box protein [Deltaproteobacteria bacterium]
MAENRLEQQHNWTRAVESSDSSSEQGRLPIMDLPLSPNNTIIEKAYYQQVFEKSPEATVILDNKDRILTANKAFEKMFQYRVNEIKGKYINDLVVGSNLGHEARELSTTVLGGKVVQKETVRRRRDGSEVAVHILGYPIILANKQIGVVGIYKDITERKQAERERRALEAQLLHSQKMEAIGTLAGGIAHDFNNLLQAIQGYSELLLMNTREGEANYAELQEILRAARRGGSLTRKLLTFGRKVESSLRPVDLNREVRGVKELLQRTIPKMIHIDLHLAPDLKPINGDPTQIEQILLNLAVNAKDAMEDGGRLTIATENTTLPEQEKSSPAGEAKQWVLLRFSDTGHGMTQETLAHIFEPFYTTKGLGKGTGLGLAMVYGVVQSHQGLINCFSEPGKGTTFKIYFPAIEAAAAQDEPSGSESVLCGGTGTILLVDDEQFIRDLGVRMLTELGYQVVTAADGETALELYAQEKGRISLVILDLIMPGIGGIKCLQELRKLDPGVKVLVASGYAPEGVLDAPLSRRANGFVSKPYDMKDLTAEVRRVLNES